MPNPRTAAEWAEKALAGAMIPGGGGKVNEYHARVGRAIESYARQVVEALRERTIEQVEAYLGVMYKAVPRDALKGYLIDTIRALRS